MNPLKELLSNVLLGLVLVMGAALFLGGRMLDSRGKELASATETIGTLQTANDQQAIQIETLKRDEIGLRKLLGTQNAALAELDNQNRKTAYGGGAGCGPAEEVQGVLCRHWLRQVERHRAILPPT